MLASAPSPHCQAVNASRAAGGATQASAASLASVSRTPGAMMPRGSMAANRSAALACASSSRAERIPSSSTRLFLANGQRLE